MWSEEKGGRCRAEECTHVEPGPGVYGQSLRFRPPFPTMETTTKRFSSLPVVFGVCGVLSENGLSSWSVGKPRSMVPNVARSSSCRCCCPCCRLSARSAVAVVRSARSVGESEEEGGVRTHRFWDRSSSTSESSACGLNTPHTASPEVPSILEANGRLPRLPRGLNTPPENRISISAV
jgi:hypothetical protein